MSFKDRFLTQVCQTFQKDTLEISKGKYLGFSCDHILSQQQMEVALEFVASIGKLNPRWSPGTKMKKQKVLELFGSQTAYIK